MSIKSILTTYFPDQLDFKYNLAVQAIEEFYTNLPGITLQPNQVKLFGADKESSFEEIINESDLENKALEIYKSNDYYDFIKFIWVQYPDNSEKRLVDVIPMQ